jgi:hypothetical protein
LPIAEFAALCVTLGQQVLAKLSGCDLVRALERALERGPLVVVRHASSQHLLARSALP